MLKPKTFGDGKVSLKIPFRSLPRLRSDSTHVNHVIYDSVISNVPYRKFGIGRRAPFLFTFSHRIHVRQAMGIVYREKCHRFIVSCCRKSLFFGLNWFAMWTWFPLYSKVFLWKICRLVHTWYMYFLPVDNTLFLWHCMHPWSLVKKNVTGSMEIIDDRNPIFLKWHTLPMLWKKFLFLPRVTIQLPSITVYWKP